MPDVVFTLSAAHLTRLIDAVCAVEQYQATINGAPNPETRAQFTKRKIGEHIKSLVQVYENDLLRQSTIIPRAVEIDIT